MTHNCSTETIAKVVQEYEGVRRKHAIGEMVRALKIDAPLVFNVAPAAIWIAPLLVMPCRKSNVPLFTLSVPELLNSATPTVNVPVAVSRVNVPALAKVD